IFARSILVRSASNSMPFSVIASKRRRSAHTTPFPFPLAAPSKLRSKPHTTKRFHPVWCCEICWLPSRTGVVVCTPRRARRRLGKDGR
ncbi:hypothetical protein PHISCL_10907, partial [Aspergillus sclerotialis]